MTLDYFFGTLVIACFVAYFAWRNSYKTRLAAASSEFRTLLIAEAHKITSIGFGDGIEQRLLSYTNTITPAVATFQSYVPLFKRSGFGNAWREHQQDCQNNIPHSCSPAQILYGNGSRVKAAEAFSHGVNRLLAYAPHT